ncbi:MAG TPA: YuiB family protein [Pseudogracilibacillus sp.]|nr:YuiB family protein [Pseudogracilibacillus sp.]
MNLIQFFVSFILYFVIFFGLAFILNMLLRTTWLMTLLYPIIILLVISGNGLADYFIDTKEAFLQIQHTINTVTLDDYIILSGGLIGTIVSAIVIRMLRRSGYQMF